VGGQEIGQQPDQAMLADASAVSTVGELAELLRRLRRRQARRMRDTPWTYRELAARTGWARSAIGQYLSGRTLPPTDRFDALVELFGATPVERGVLATVRDRVEEAQRRPWGGPPAGRVADAEAAGPAVAGASGGWAPVVPRQLPARVPGFAGRAAALALLDGLLDSDAPYPAVVISTVSGTAGVGKTALAVHWAHRVADRFPDGQLFVNLRGFEPAGPPMAPAEAVRGFLDALGVPPERVPPDLNAQVGLYRSVLAGRRVLIVLDNAAAVEQVRPLLPGSAGCLVLVTSRYRLTALTVVDGARPLPLDLLTVDEAGDLLAGRLGAGRLTAEPGAARVLIDACARLPLALSIVAARAASNPRFTLASLGAELTGSNGLDVLDGGDAATDLRSVLSWSYERLTPAAARMFRLMGLHPGPDVSAAAASSLAGTDARPMLADLTRANLLIEHTPGRYTFHDLLRTYATELADAYDAEERAAARGRILDHYLHTAHAAARHIAAHRNEVTPEPPRCGVAPEPISNHQRAMAWFGAERAVLLAAIRQAATTGAPTHTWQLAWSVFFFLHMRGRWDDALGTQQVAFAAARDTGDPAAQAMVCRDLAHAYTRLDRYDEAGAHLRQALRLHAGLGDRDGVAWTHHRIAWTADQRGRHAEAIHHSDQALRLFHETGNLWGRAHVLNCTGWYHAQLGDQQRALDHCRQAFDLYRVLDNDIGQANALDSIGYAHHHLGEHERAAAYYNRALEFFRRLGEPYYTAQALAHLGDALDAMGDDAARAAWQEALAIFDGLGHSNADGIRVRLRDEA
jgi:tetratricopeptide (TPR) repeat protein/transcriptional regulator with XRE-family HTH domain